MFQITNMWHVAIPVEDLQRSVNFYCKVLGFSLLGYDEYSSKKQAFVEVTKGGINLELFEPKTDKDSRLSRKPDHLAFEVHNMEEFYQNLKNQFIDSSKVSVSEDGMKCMSLKDPDGMPIEFFEGRHLYEEYIRSRNSVEI